MTAGERQVATAQRQPTWSDRLPSSVRRLTVFLEHRFTAVVVAMATVIAVLGVLGIAALQAPSALALFDLDAEGTVPPAWSGLLLGSCALAALTLAALTPATPTPAGAARGGWGMWVLALFFGLMALDEVFALHEYFERQTGIDWQLLYSPVIAVAGVVFLMVAWSGRRQRGFLLTWLAGAFAWGVAQLLEMAEWDGAVQRSHYEVKMVPEELLEMAGSTCWLVALLLALIAASSSRTDGGGRPPVHTGDVVEHSSGPSADRTLR